MFKIKSSKKPREGIGARIDHKYKATTNNSTFAINAPKHYNILPAALRFRNPIWSGDKFKRELKAHIKTQHLLTKH